MYYHFLFIQCLYIPSKNKKTTVTSNLNTTENLKNLILESFS